MLQAQTKLTSQGQVSVPAAFRNLMGLTPGSILEWTQDGETVTVRRAVKHSSLEVHQALFPQGHTPAPAKTLEDLKQGIRQHMQQRHAGS